MSAEKRLEPGTVFISHSSRDNKVSEELRAALEAEGLPCWMDDRNIPGSADWNDAIMRGIMACRVLLLVYTRHSAESDPVRREVERAVARKIPVLPVRLEDYPPPPAMEYLIASRQYVDAFPHSIDRHMEKVIAAVKHALEMAHEPKAEGHAAFAETIGPYHLLGPLGEGGMGTVYKAEQRVPVKRLVAIKVIKAGLDTKDVLARFESERQALARMDHPNIARVLDAGQDGQRPYFVMEFVPGVPITEFADQNRLSVKQRLLLFTQVCDAIAHAHSKSILHRDIKPTNVLAYMADGKPVAKVIDFGIAKALTGDRLTDRTFNTEFGKAIGTYNCMSPEQAAGSPDIDTKSDVYSLGVLLYELLTGVQPFDRDTLAKAADEEVRRIIREVEPPRPSTRVSGLGLIGQKAAELRQATLDSLAKQLRSELEWIPLMAMRKERARRYASVEKLSEDVGNYLAGQPLLAGPESRAYRMQKFVRRHRGALLTSVAFVLLAALATGVYVQDIRAEQAKTLAALEDAEEQRNLAVQSSKLAAQRFEEKRVALDQMLDTFSADQLKGQPGSQLIRKMFLERGIAEYESIMAEGSDDPKVVTRVGQAYRELGAVAKELGETEEGLRNIQKAVDLARAASEAAPDDAAARAALGDALFHLGQSMFEASKSEETAMAAQESIAIFEALLATEPSSARYKAGLGRAITLKATHPEYKLTPDDSRAVELLREAVAAEPKNAEFLADYGRAVNSLAVSVYRDSGKWGLEQFLEAAEIETQALELNPALAMAHIRRIRMVRNATYELGQTGRDAEALELVEKYVESSRRFVTENPAVTAGQIAMADLMNERALILQRLGRYAEAIPAYEEIVVAYEALAQRDSRKPDYAIRSLRALTAIPPLQSRGTPGADGGATWERAIARCTEALKRHPDAEEIFGMLMTSLDSRTTNEANKGNDQSTLEWRLKAVETFETYARDVKPAPGDWAIGLYLGQANEVANGYIKGGEFQKAIDLLKQPLEWGAKLDDPNDHNQSFYVGLNARARAYTGLGDLDKARADLELAADRSTKDLEKVPYHYWTRSNRIGQYTQLAEIYRKQGDLRREIETMRLYLKEKEWHDKTQTAKIFAETEAISGESAELLREKVKEISAGGFKRFTVPVVFSGVKYPYHIYISGNIEPFRDQVRWVREARGGEFPKEVVDSFERLYAIAVENNVSFPDLCVYALGTAAAEDSPSAALYKRIADLKKLLEDSPRDTSLLLDLAETTMAYANRLNETKQPADSTLKSVDDAELALNRGIEAGLPRAGRVSAVFADASVLRGRIYTENQRAKEGYAELLKAMKLAGDADTSSSLIMTTAAADLGRASEALERPMEAAQWYFRSALEGNAEALGALAALYAKDESICYAFPPRFVERLNREAPAGAERNKSEEFMAAWDEEYPHAIKKQEDQAAEEDDPAEMRFTVQPNPMIDKSLSPHPDDAEKVVILLLYGRTSANEKTFIYLKIKLKDMKRLSNLMADGGTFLPSEYGEVVASGEGEPSEELKKKIAEDYKKLDETVNAQIGKQAAPEEPSTSDADGGTSATTQAPGFGMTPDGVSADSRAEPIAEIFKDDYGVVFLQGKNTEGKQIYTYLKVTVPEYKRLQVALSKPDSFNPEDYGEVVAAGEGEPAPEVVREIGGKYPMFDTAKAIRDPSGAGVSPSNAEVAKATQLDAALEGEYTIVLLRGLNSKGVKIYVFLKTSVPGVKRLEEALKGDEEFNAGDYGEVVASGYGDPPADVREELSKSYTMLERDMPIAANK